MYTYKENFIFITEDNMNTFNVKYRFSLKKASDWNEETAYDLSESNDRNILESEVFNGVRVWHIAGEYLKFSDTKIYFLSRKKIIK